MRETSIGCLPHVPQPGPGNLVPLTWNRTRDPEPSGQSDSRSFGSVLTFLSSRLTVCLLQLHWVLRLEVGGLPRCLTPYIVRLASVSLLWALRKTIPKLLCDCVCTEMNSRWDCIYCVPFSFKRSIFVASACVWGPGPLPVGELGLFFRSQCLGDRFPSWATLQVCKLQGQHSKCFSLWVACGLSCVCTAHEKC